MPIRIAQASVIHRQAPIERPVTTSFGSMTMRHAVLFVVADAQGRTGVGESWINFPPWAPFERVAALEQTFAPLVSGAVIDDIPAFMVRLEANFRGPAQQAGAMGPLLQASCGIELALWDLQARTENRPLCRLWFQSPASRVRVYGSGINAPLPFEQIKHYLDCGVSLFKFKLGFGREQDFQNLGTLKEFLGSNAEVAVDANRKWPFAEAVEYLKPLRDAGVRWLEEPLRVEDEHRLGELQAMRIVPIAAGENICMPPDADTGRLAALELAIVQPDITKYCSPSTALKLIAKWEGRGCKVVPHFLGSAPGQLASLHLAAGCAENLVEWDINANPLHTQFYPQAIPIHDGHVEIPERPGLGWEL